MFKGKGGKFLRRNPRGRTASNIIEKKYNVDDF